MIKYIKVNNMNEKSYFTFAILILFLLNINSALAAVKIESITEDSIQEIHLFEKYYIFKNIDYDFFYSDFIQKDYPVGQKKENWTRRIEKVQFNNDDLYPLPDILTELNLRCVRNDSCDKSKFLADGYGFSGKNLNLIVFKKTENKSQISKTDIDIKFDYTEKFQNVSYREYGFLINKKEFGYKTIQIPNWAIAPQHYYTFTIKVPEKYEIVDFYPHEYVHTLDNNRITWNFYGSPTLDVNVVYAKPVIVRIIEFLKKDDFLTLILLISALGILLGSLIRWDLKIKTFLNDLTREPPRLNRNQIIFGILLVIIIPIVVIFKLWNLNFVDGIILFLIFFWVFYFFNKTKNQYPK